MKPFEYLRPATLADVMSILAAWGPGVRFLAGGTDLTVGLRHGKIETDIVLDLKAVEEMRPRIVDEDDCILMHGHVTMMDICRHPAIRAGFEGLAEAAEVVGSRQIRNRATVIGNICNASPAADTVPLLAAFDASVVIAGPDGTRERPVTEFILGNRRIDLGPGELVTGVRLPRPQRPTASAFGRITRRRGVDLASVNIGCVLHADGTVIFGLGAVSPRPLIVRDDTGTLPREASGPARKQRLAQLMSAAKPISDVRASAEYRLAMLGVLADRSLEKAGQRLEHTINA